MDKLKILVIDDEPAVTKVVGRLLARNGYSVIELNDPRKVEDVILYTDLSLVITDVLMPGVNGLEVLDLIKRCKPELPVLMLSGQSSIDIAVEATKLGASAFLTKPINTEGLLKAVSDYIEVDGALPDGMKDFIESSLSEDDAEFITEPDKILLKDEIVSTESVPEGLVDIDFTEIVAGQFLSFSMYIQIFNKKTGKYYLKKISNENTVFTSGLKEILEKRELGSVFIRQKDYKDFLEYQKAMKSTPTFKLQRVRDDKRLLLYGKAVESINQILAEPGTHENMTAAIDLVDDLFKNIVDYPTTYQDLFKLFKKDATIYTHLANTCLLAVSFGVYLGIKPEAVKILGLGAMLHDVGMSRIERKVLDKQGPLNRLEWDEIKKHPERGYAMLKPAVIVPMPALRIVLEHHEKPDGTGYPRGAKEEQISQLTRIFQLIDKFDGMTTKRPYRHAFSASEAVKRIFFEEPSERYQKVIRRFINFLGGS